MSLEHHQREMRRLLCESPELWDSASDYARLVARSHGLRLARQIVHEWRCCKIQRYAMMTSELLKQLGQFDEEVTRFAAVAPSAYVEAIGSSFLAHVCGNEDPLIAAVARFESAAINAKRSPTVDPVVITWPCNPDPLLAALLERRSIQGLASTDGVNASFETIVCGRFPSLFHVRRR